MLLANPFLDRFIMIS